MNLKFDTNGLVTAVVQDWNSKEVLMVAMMNSEAFELTRRSKLAHFWSRSRQKYWMKGESSGNVQDVKDVYTDCDKDTLIVEVVQHGSACHEGYYSCFYRRLNDAGEWEVISKKLFDPEEVYKDN